MKSANTILPQYLIPILADLPNKNINHKLLLQKDGKKCDSKVLPSINYYEPISFLKKMKEFCEEKEQSKTLVRKEVFSVQTILSSGPVLSPLRLPSS